MNHVAGIPRQQLVLFPESPDEYIAADNPVRFIDAFVDSLDLAAAGFSPTSPPLTSIPTCVLPPSIPPTSLDRVTPGYYL